MKKVNFCTYPRVPPILSLSDGRNQNTILTKNPERKRIELIFIYEKEEYKTIVTPKKISISKKVNGKWVKLKHGKEKFETMFKSYLKK